MEIIAFDTCDAPQLLPRMEETDAVGAAHPFSISMCEVSCRVNTMNMELRRGLSPYPPHVFDGCLCENVLESVRRAIDRMYSAKCW